MTELQYKFKAQLRRIVRLEGRLISKGFQLSKSYIPKQPKRITEQTIKRLEDITAQTILKGAKVQEGENLIPALKTKSGQQYVAHSRAKSINYNYYVSKVSRKGRSDKGSKKGKRPFTYAERSDKGTKRGKRKKVYKTRKDKGIKRPKSIPVTSLPPTQPIPITPKEAEEPIEEQKEYTYFEMYDYVTSHGGEFPEGVKDETIEQFMYVDNINRIITDSINEVSPIDKLRSLKIAELSYIIDKWHDLCDMKVKDLYDKFNGLRDELKELIDRLILSSRADEVSQISHEIIKML